MKNVRKWFIARLIAKWTTCLRNCRSSIGQWRIRAGFLEPRAYRYWPTNWQKSTKCIQSTFNGSIFADGANQEVGNTVICEQFIAWEVSTSTRVNRANWYSIYVSLSPRRPRLPGECRVWIELNCFADITSDLSCNNSISSLIEFGSK